jgi:hypothetical protein
VPSCDDESPGDPKTPRETRGGSDPRSVILPRHLREARSAAVLVGSSTELEWACCVPVMGVMRQLDRLIKVLRVAIGDLWVDSRRDVLTPRSGAVP